MKLTIRHKHGDHYHLRNVEVPDAANVRIDAIIRHGYHFVVETISNFDVVTVERDDQEIELAIIRKSEEWNDQILKLVDRTYDIVVHEAFPAHDATLPEPFVPFEPEVVEPQPKRNPHIDDIAWEDGDGNNWRVWE